MNKTLTAVLGVALLLAFAVPAMQATEQSNREANIEWMLERRADMDPTETVTVHMGGEAIQMSALEAVELFGDHSERVDIPALIAGASHAPTTVLAGDIWILEDSYTPGPCPTANVLGQSPLPEIVEVTDQLWIYGGPGFVAHDEAHSDVASRPGLPIGLHFGWTTKTLGDHTGSQSSLIGVSDLFCIDWGFLGTTWFPYGDGVAYIG